MKTVRFFLHPPEPRNAFNMRGIREQINGLQRIEAISEVMELRRVTRQSLWAARDIDHCLRLHGGNDAWDRGFKPFSRRVDKNRFRLDAAAADIREDFLCRAAEKFGIG